MTNSALQRELTDFVDEDIQDVEETAGNDDCLYVFTYVGVVTMGNRVIKSYPKYILSDSEPFVQMKQVVRVLERYNRSEEQIINLFNGDGDNRSFNILAVILYLLNDYFENGIYSNTENVLEINGEGDIVWGRTIDDGLAIIEDGRSYYTELVTRRTIEDDNLYLCFPGQKDAGGGSRIQHVWHYGFPWGLGESLLMKKTALMLNLAGKKRNAVAPDLPEYIIIERLCQL